MPMLFSRESANPEYYQNHTLSPVRVNIESILHYAAGTAGARCRAKTKRVSSSSRPGSFSRLVYHARCDRRSYIVGIENSDRKFRNDCILDKLFFTLEAYILSEKKKYIKSNILADK